MMRMSGITALAKRFNGTATHRPMRSGDCSAAIFGICSPNTTCMYVMSDNVQNTLTSCLTVPAQLSGSERNNGAMTSPSAGSLTKPSARLATVMPSWAAATLRSICVTASRKALARGTFWLTSSSTRVRRIATIANSAETK